MKTKRVRAWCPHCRKRLVVELAEGELFVKRECPQCRVRINFAGLSMVEQSIELMRHEERRCGDAGYYLAFSGGKDSIALYRLAEMAGVKFDAHYSMTTIDPPEEDDSQPALFV